MKKSLMLAVLAIVILLAVGVSSAFADTATITAGTYVAKTATDVVTVSATVNPLLVMTVTTPGAAQTVNFGNVNPGQTYTQPVTVNVWSNKGYTFGSATGGSSALMGLSTVAFGAAWPKSPTNAGQAFADTYTVNVPWNTDPNPYTATVTYTVVQN